MDLFGNVVETTVEQEQEVVEEVLEAKDITNSEHKYHFVQTAEERAKLIADLREMDFSFYSRTVFKFFAISMYEFVNESKVIIVCGIQTFTISKELIDPISKIYC